MRKSGLGFNSFFAPILSKQVGWLVNIYDLSLILYVKSKQLLYSVKEDPGLHVPGAYRIPWSYGKFDIGQTVKTILERCSEHAKYIGFQQADKSGVAEYCLINGHQAFCDLSQVLSKKSSFWESLIVE